MRHTTGLDTCVSEDQALAELFESVARNEPATETAARQRPSLSAVQPPPPAMSVAARAFEEARELAYRVSAIVDTLCGPVPTAGSQTDGKEGPAQSVLDSMKQDAIRTVKAIREASEQLNRLSRELP